MDTEEEFEIEIIDENEEATSETSEQETTEQEDAHQSEKGNEEDKGGDSTEEKEKSETQSRPRRTNRAQKRIQQLVSEKKTIETQLEEERKKREELESQFKTNLKKTKETTKNLAESTVKTLEANIEQALENEDYKTAVKLQSQLSDARLKSLAVSYEDDDEDPGFTQEKQPSQQDTVQYPEPFIEFVEDNPWFTEPTTKDERRAQRLIKKIGEELDEEGYDYNDDDFYEEARRRLQNKVNELQLDIEGYEITRKAPEKPTQSPTGGSKSPSSGRKKYQLSKAEVEMAQRLGLTAEAYLKSKLKMKERGQ